MRLTTLALPKLLVAVALTTAVVAYGQEEPPPAEGGGSRIQDAIRAASGEEAGEATSIGMPPAPLWDNYGPYVYDGSGRITLEVPAPAEGQPAYEIVSGTVRVRVDGQALLPTDFAVCRVAGTQQYLVRFLRDVPPGSAIDASFAYTVGTGAEANVLSMGLIARPDAAVTLPIGSGGQSVLPFKMYYGREAALTGAGTTADALSALRGLSGSVAPGQRHEYGFSITDMTVGKLQLTYGTVRNEEAGGESSYRDEFVNTYLLSGGATAGLRAGDAAGLAPEGDARDLVWSGLRYGSPETDKIWYTSSSVRMDANYSAVGGSGVNEDVQAFLQDTTRWGGRNLASKWWSGAYSGAWQSFEVETSGVAANKGRTDLSGFTGVEIGYNAYGFRPVNWLSYEKSEFSQERLSDNLRLTETLENVQLDTPGGGPEVRYTENTLAATRPPTVPIAGATERDVLEDAGADTVTTHQTLSLSQRLAGGDNPPMLRVTNHQWNALDRLSGIETPTRTDRLTAVDNLSVAGMSLNYSNQRYEYEDTTLDPSESHTLSFSNVRVGGPISLQGSLAAETTDARGLQRLTSNVAIPGFRIFEGVNLSTATYQRERDAHGGVSLHRSLGFNGAALGGEWNTGVSWLSQTGGYQDRNGNNANPYGQDFTRKQMQFNYIRNVGSLHLITGWENTTLNDESLGQTYKLGARKTVKLGDPIPGQLTLWGMQYRNVDRWNVLRPSYSWAAQYNAPEDRIVAGVRSFEHYGAGDELSFTNSSAWVRGKVGSATLGVEWRKNPLLNDEAAKAGSRPFVWLGSSREYKAEMPLTKGLVASVSLSENALPQDYIVASEFGSMLFSGRQSDYLRPTTWNWAENWQTKYSISYAFGSGSSLSLSRAHTRFNSTGADLLAWQADLSWQIAPEHQLTLKYRTWSGNSPIYGNTVTAGDVGHPLGDSFALGYRHAWGAKKDRSLSLIVVDAGPLAEYYSDSRNQWYSEASDLHLGMPTDIGSRPKFWLEFQTPL